MLPDAAPLRVAPLAPLISSRSAEADRTRSLSSEVIAALKANDVMRLTAADSIGGLSGSIVDIGRELSMAAAACASTAWCLWNHLATFHAFCGLLGPANADLLEEVTRNHRWVCLPAGAGTAVRGRVEGDSIVLNGKASFGTGARYADHLGVSFVMQGERAVRFALVAARQPGVRIDADWKAMSASRGISVFGKTSNLNDRRGFAGGSAQELIFL